MQMLFWNIVLSGFNSGRKDLYKLIKFICQWLLMKGNSQLMHFQARYLIMNTGKISCSQYCMFQPIAISLPTTPQPLTFRYLIMNTGKISCSQYCMFQPIAISLPNTPQPLTFRHIVITTHARIVKLFMVEVSNRHLIIDVVLDLKHQI